MEEGHCAAVAGAEVEFVRVVDFAVALEDVLVGDGGRDGFHLGKEAELVVEAEGGGSDGDAGAFFGGDGGAAFEDGEVDTGGGEDLGEGEADGTAADYYYF